MTPAARVIALRQDRRSEKEEPKKNVVAAEAVDSAFADPTSCEDLYLPARITTCGFVDLPMELFREGLASPTPTLTLCLMLRLCAPVRKGQKSVAEMHQEVDAAFVSGRST